MPGIYYPNCIASLHVVFDTGQKDADAPEIHTIEVRPKSASVHLNGYREADTFSMEFDAASFPFSPELVRSMGVEIRIFQNDGLGSQKPSTKGKFTNEEELVIAGLVDDAHYHVGGDGRMFQISGRDYTALLLDRQWDQTKRFPVGIPLDVAVQQLVDEAANAKRTGRVLTVKVVGTDAVPTLGQANRKASALTTAGKFSVSKKGKLKVPNSGQGNVHHNKKGIPVHGGSSYWDVIYRQCIRLGLIVFVRGTDVIISTPQTLIESTGGRSRRVAYGRDLATLDIDRKLGKETVPQIEVVCYDPKSRQSISAKFPEGKVKPTTGIGTKKDETQLVTVHGITDPGQLAKIAEMYYNNLARAEATIKFTTKDLKDLDGNDLIFLRPGDPVLLGFEGIFNEDFKQRTDAERFDYLQNLNYSSNVAKVIAQEYDRWSKFEVPFYTKDVQLDWSQEGGLAVDVVAMNYISPPRDNATG